jgi:hypothetical protein
VANHFGEQAVVIAGSLAGLIKTLLNQTLRWLLEGLESYGPALAHANQAPNRSAGGRRPPVDARRRAAWS